MDLRERLQDISASGALILIMDWRYICQTCKEADARIAELETQVQNSIPAPTNDN
jgi:hypothetical protein